MSAQFHWNPETYLEEIRAEVPRYDELQRATVDAIPFPPDRVLELGMGTGETTRVLLESYPDAWVIGLDSSPEMVFHLRQEYDDVQLARMEDPLPDGPWDAIVSALAIHHLADLDKASLFTRVREALTPGGVFVNAEQVAGTSPALEDYNLRRHEQAARALGADDSEWDAAVARMRHDRKVTVERHLAWFREAGFADADCLFKDHSFAVLVARA
jgi:tRNA (cmo5U34)-methyltransferase